MVACGLRWRHGRLSQICSADPAAGKDSSIQLLLHTNIGSAAQHDFAHIQYSQEHGTLDKDSARVIGAA
jgi:hypothetical protein